MTTSEPAVTSRDGAVDEAAVPHDGGRSRLRGRAERTITSAIRRPDLITLVVAGAVVVGALLRMLGSAWGLPLFLHPDEGVIVNGALDMAKRNSFEPAVYFRPDHLEIKLNYIVFTAYAHLFHHAPADVVAQESLGTFYLIARMVTALFGVGMIVLAYLIGRHVNRVVGAMSAVVIALFPIYVEDSHYVTPDVPLSFAFMVIMLGCMNYLRRPGWGSLLVSAAAVSASVAIKYPGALASVMIAVVVTIAAARSGDWVRFAKHAAGSVLAVVGFLFVISPSLFTNKAAVVEAISKEARTTHLGADGLGWGGNLAFYGEALVSRGGWILVACFLLGAFWSVRRKMLLTVPLWLGAVFWVVLSKLPLHWERWGLPMYLSALLIAPIGAYFTWDWIRRSGRGLSWAKPVAWVVSVIVVLNLLLGSIATMARFLVPDTLNSGRVGLEERGVTAENSVFEGYTPFRPGAPRVVFGLVDVGTERIAPVGEAAGAEYLVLSGCMGDRYEAEPDRYPGEVAFYEAVGQRLEEVVHYPRVAPVDLDGIEAINIYRSVEKIHEFRSGGMTGCEIRVFRFADEDS